ncbi:MAG: RNA polymerase sigma factor [Lachnospiraceae bacterium]|jgi:RNA polymerase sigma factor (sigma-70 family)|nr:RNA polymerase sigma factor [Lachnospiraceae bacterium]
MRTQKEILGLYEKYYEMVWRICLVQLGNSHDAYDAVQETFFRLMGNAKTFHNEEHVKAWLIRVAINYCKDVKKSGFRKREISLNAEKPTEDGGVPEEYAEVYEAMMGLPKEHRVVLYLHYYEGYSLKEIAKMMKINPSTLRSRMSRAKELMKQYLQDDARRF